MSDPNEVLKKLAVAHFEANGGETPIAAQTSDTIAVIKQLLEEYYELCTRMQTLLDGVALAFKRPPAPLHRHSWHDLPAIAERMMRDREALRNDELRLTAKLKATESHEQAVFLVGYLVGIIGRYTQPLKADDGPTTTTA